MTDDSLVREVKQLREQLNRLQHWKIAAGDVAIKNEKKLHLKYDAAHQECDYLQSKIDTLEITVQTLSEEVIFL